MNVCCSGRAVAGIIPFTLLVRVAKMSLAGTLLVAAEPDLSSAQVCFADEPTVEVDVTVEVTAGMFPLPLQDTVSGLIRDALSGYVRDYLVAPAQTEVAILGKLTERLGVTDEEYERAERAVDAARAIAAATEE